MKAKLFFIMIIIISISIFNGCGKKDDGTKTTDKVETKSDSKKDENISFDKPVRVEFKIAGSMTGTLNAIYYQKKARSESTYEISGRKMSATGYFDGGEYMYMVTEFGGQKMGIDPMKNSFVELAAKKLGMPEIKVIGDNSKYEDWDNVMWGVNYMLDYGEEQGSISNVLGYLSSQMDPDFPMKDKKPSWITNMMRGIFAWFVRTISMLE